MRKMWLVPVLTAASILGLAVVVPPAAAFAAPGVQLAAADTPVEAPGDRILGKADAPITIFEYASLTCPHCAAFETETLPKLKKEWIDTGKAKLILRAFPLDASALKASVLARCAPPERFYGFIETLFASQEAWGRSADPTPGLERIAKLGGMSEDQFKACMSNDAIEKEVLAMRMAGAKQYGVESTPTFFINGKKLVGAQPYEQFETMLKAAS